MSTDDLIALMERVRENCAAWCDTNTDDPTIGASLRKMPLPKIAALSSAPAAEAGWRPIETAPRDGTRILLRSTLKVSEGSWGVCRPQWDGYRAGGGNETWRAPDTKKLFGGVVTHWMPMPLPPPPETEK